MKTIRKTFNFIYWAFRGIILTILFSLLLPFILIGGAIQGVYEVFEESNPPEYVDGEKWITEKSNS